MIEPYQGEVDLNYTFESALDYLKARKKIQLKTQKKTEFTAEAATTKGDERPFIKFCQNGIEYARCYKECWATVTIMEKQS